MNFRKWFNLTCKHQPSMDYEFFARDNQRKGWKACKKEILKLLKEDKLAYHEAVNSGTIEKIEKL